MSFSLLRSLRDASAFQRVLVVLLAVSVAIQVALLLLGRGLEVELLRDDAFYMFDVAANFAAGEGFSFDGVHVAGGVQVLWTLLLALPALVFGKSALPLASILLGLCFLLASTALAYRLARRYCDADAALVLAAFVMARPFVVREAMNGQETALGLFVLLVVVRRGLDALEGKASGRGLLVWTLLLPWARSELVLVPCALCVVFEVGRRARLLPPAANRRLEVAMAASLAVYLLLQQLFFGRLWPVSGDAIPWLFHEQFSAKDPSLGQWVQRTWWYLRPLLLGGPWQVLGVFCALVLAAFALAPIALWRRFAPLVLVGVAALIGAEDLVPLFFAAVLLSFAGRIFGTLYRVNEGAAVVGAMLGFAGIAGLHLVVRWYPRDYYWMPLVVPALLGMAVLAGRWLGELGLHALVPRPRRLHAFCIVVLLASLQGFGAPRDAMPWQAEMRFAARQASQLFGAEPIAAFNAGLLGFEHGGPVRCLDGVVDGAAFEALRERRLAAWLRDEGFALVLDTPRQLANDDPDPYGPHASGRYLGPRGRDEVRPYIAFDLVGVGGEHEGTDCQVLFVLADAEAPSCEVTPRVLERDGDHVVLFLPNERFVLRSEGRERPLRFAVSASRAAFVVTRLPARPSLLMLGERELLRW